MSQILEAWGWYSFGSQHSGRNFSGPLCWTNQNLSLMCFIFLGNSGLFATRMGYHSLVITQKWDCFESSSVDILKELSDPGGFFCCLSTCYKLRFCSRERRTALFPTERREWSPMTDENTSWCRYPVIRISSMIGIYSQSFLFLHQSRLRRRKLHASGYRLGNGKFF